MRHTWVCGRGVKAKEGKNPWRANVLKSTETSNTVNIVIKRAKAKQKGKTKPATLCIKAKDKSRKVVTCLDLWLLRILASIVNQSPRLKESNHKTTHTGNSIFPMLHHVTGKKKTEKIVSEERKKVIKTRVCCISSCDVYGMKI